MPTVNLVGGTSPNANVSFTDQWVQSSGHGIAVGRTAASGGKPIRIVRIFAFAAGRLASRSCTLSFNGASTDSFTIGSAGSAQSTGWQDISSYDTNGGSATLRITCNGSFYFGRNSGADGDVVSSYGSTFDGALSGQYDYDEVPSAPSGLSATPGDNVGEVLLEWSAPSTNGGTSITGYRIQYSTSPTFASGVVTVNTGDTDLSHLLTGLAPGQRYYFRVGAINAVSANYSTTGPWSGTANAAVVSGGKVRVDGAWVSGNAKVRVGDAWVPATVKVRVDGAWVTPS